MKLSATVEAVNGQGTVRGAVTHADTIPFLRAAVEWARYNHFAQGLAVQDAAFVRDAPYKAPEERRHMRAVFRAMRRNVNGHGAGERFYGFLAACLVMHDRELRKV